jgi:hypothetical protein
MQALGKSHEICICIAVDCRFQPQPTGCPIHRSLIAMGGNVHLLPTSSRLCLFYVPPKYSTEGGTLAITKASSRPKAALLPLQKRHLDRRRRFCRRSGETPVFRLCLCSCFSASPPQNRHPERSLSHSHRERRSRRTPESSNPLEKRLFPLENMFQQPLLQPNRVTSLPDAAQSPAAPASAHELADCHRRHTSYLCDTRTL